MTEQPRPGATGPLWGPAGAPADTPPPPPVPPIYAPQPPPSRRRPHLVVLGVVAIVCLLGTVLTIAIFRATDEQAAPVAGVRTTTPETTYQPSAPPSSEPAPSPTTTTTTAPSAEWVPPSTTVDATAPPAGYRMVSGPEGVQVAIPAEWHVRQGAVPSNMQADSPSADKLVRFGGSASTSMPLLDTVATNETDNPNIANGYERIRLEYVSAAAETVDWEFRFVKDGVLKHSYGRYWRLGGIDYVVYASTTDALWYSMAEVVDVMVNTASPIS